MIEPIVFKANDLRGVTGTEWDEIGARAVGAAFVAALGLQGGRFVLGRDTRHRGWEYSRAFAEGAMSAGASVIDIGLASTDQLWFASGHTGLAGVQFTASHNPSSYNGVKFCLPYAAPITPELMARIRELTYAPPAPEAEEGSLVSTDLLGAYAAHLHSMVELSGWRRLRVVVDAGNGMAGHTTPAVLGPLDLEITGLFLELDGDFPNHPPNPLEPANLVAARRAVGEYQADLALVFDGDADRCFIIDERGEVVPPASVVALIAREALATEPGGRIVVNTITSAAVAQVVEAAGGTVVVGPVGHTSIKALMASHDAVFGGEHSAHYYFRDFWGADTGMLAALHVLAMVGRTTTPLSELVAQLPRCAASGELNFAVADPQAVTAEVAAAFAGLGEVGHPDGLLVRGADWWVSVRSSNTEPLLRLNVEAPDLATMAELRDRALAILERRSNPRTTDHTTTEERNGEPVT